MDKNIFHNWGQTDVFSRRAEFGKYKKENDETSPSSARNENQKQAAKDRLDLSPEALQAAEELSKSSTLSETSEKTAADVAGMSETSSTDTTTNHFVDLCDMRLAVLDRINTIIAESELEIQDNAFQVELDRRDGSIAIRNNMWESADESDLNALQETIANDEQLAFLLEETYATLHHGDVEKMKADSFRVTFHSLDPRNLIEERDRSFGLVGWSNNTLNEDYKEGDVIEESLIGAAAPSVTGLDRRLPGYQSPAWVSDIRDNRTAALQRVNDIIQEKGLDISEGGFVLQYDQKKGTISVEASDLWTFNSERESVQEPSMSEQSRAILQKALDNDSELAGILQSVYTSLKDGNMLDDSVTKFGLEFGSRDVEREKNVWSTMLEERSNNTSNNAANGDSARSVVLMAWNIMIPKTSATLQFVTQGITELPNTNTISPTPAEIVPPNRAPSYADLKAAQTATQKTASANTSEKSESAASNSLSKISSLLGLGRSSDVSSVLKSLRSSIKSESEALQKKLAEKLKQAGLEKETKKMTFSVNAKGKITVAGLNNKIKQKEIENILNADPDLLEEMKSLKAKMDIEQGLNSGANFDSKEFDTARRQLLKDYLKGSNINLSEISTSVDPKTGETLWNLNGNANELLQEIASDSILRDEILGALESKKTSSSGSEQTLVSMHRGVIGSGTEEEVDFEAGARKLKGSVLAKLNEFYANGGTPLDQQITNFTLRISSSGGLSVDDVQLATDADPKAKAGARKLLASLFDDAIRGEAKNLGLGILEQHDAEHGDVEEFNHHIIVGGSDKAYKVLSPEADRAAWAELTKLGQEISAELGSFFRSSYGLNQAFQMEFDAQGNISFDKSAFESRLMAKQIEKAFDALNERLASDDPMGDDFSQFLPLGLQGVVEKLVELNEVRQKFHEEPMKNATLSLTIPGK